MADRASFDVVVIGGGPGGYVAALRAAGHGMSVAVVEHGRLGGVCANQGCIPTKALLRSAEVFSLVKNAASFGVKADGVAFDLAAVVDRAKKTAARMEKSVESLLRGAKIPVHAGSARLAGKGRVELRGESGTTTLEAKHIVLATGARPRVPQGFESDGRLVWTYKEALVPETMPGSLLVLGAGAIGIEFASFYRTLGAEVTVVEMLPRLLPVEDAEIGDTMQKALRKQGVRMHTSAKVTSLTRAQDSVTAVIEAGGKKDEQTFDRVLVATGISANVEELGLEGSRVAIERGHVVVDEWLRTGEPGVYAIGDLTGPPWLAHKASREAVICIDRIAGVKDARPLVRELVPGCTYSMPQVASVGLTEQAATDAGRRIRVGRSTFVGNGKARAIGDTEGFAKMILDADTGELLGAHLIGPEVTELIAGLALARTLESTEAELLATVFPHPTLSEAIHEAVEAAGRSEAAPNAARG
jgi:dihydrolipoamide dehydrogenase